MSKKTESAPPIETSASKPELPAPVRPTLGRVVIFHLREGVDRVALIVGVKDATTVDLHIHMLAADHRDPVVESLGVCEGPGPGCWSWPARA